MATRDPRFALVTQARNALGFACTCPECERAVTEEKYENVHFLNYYLWHC